MTRSRYSNSLPGRMLDRDSSNLLDTPTLIVYHIEYVCISKGLNYDKSER